MRRPYTMAWTGLGFLALAALACHRADVRPATRFVRSENTIVEILASAKTNGEFNPCG